MSRNRTQTSNQGDLEAALTNDAGQAPVRELTLLELLSTGRAAPFERAGNTADEAKKAQNWDEHSLEVAKLSEERSGAYNSEPDPETPHETA